MIKYLLLSIPLFFNAPKLGSIRIAFLGDSYCTGFATPFVDSLMDRPAGYRYQTIEFFKQYYDTVITMRGCSGGENIRNAMPDWYSGRKLGFNIDSALRWNADLIVMQYSGNEFLNGVRLDTVKWCYKYINDTLTSLNVPFIFVSKQARKVSLGTGNTPDKFQDSVRTINRYIDSMNHYNYLNVFDTTYDPATNKPIWDFLGSDSLHPNVAGYAAMFGAIKVNSPIIDSAVGFDTMHLCNMQMIETVGGDSVRISFSLTQAKDVLIATSVDNVTWDQNARLFYLQGAYSVIVPKRQYVRIRARRFNKVITFTKIFL